MKRFPAIDGLRGIAILGVMVLHSWGHAGKPHLSGLATYCRFGGGGVTLFFILSGFCLFYPIVAAHREGKPHPSWRTFALRRVLRIVPAYAVATVLLIPIWLSWQPVSSLRAYFLGQTLFAHDIWLSPGIFWTLDVEARFYLSLPLLTIVFLETPVFCLIGAVVVSILAQWSIPLSHGFWAHLTEFTFGMFAAYLASDSRLKEWRGWPMLAMVGIIGVLLAPQLYSRLPVDLRPYGFRISLPFWALIVVAATQRPESLVSRTLAWKPLAALGIISYSVYLYDPITQVVGGHFPGALAWPVMFAAYIITGIISYRLAEKPFMSWRAKLRSEQGARNLVELNGLVRGVLTDSAVPGAGGC